jgi:uncharacterized protein YigE (DUF2233 family)
MKRLIVFLGIICIVGAGVFFVQDQIKKNAKVLPATSVITSVPTPSPTIEIKQSVIIDVQETPIRVSWAIAEPEKIELYSNLKDKYLSEQIKVDNSCQTLVSGGFYSKENTHLGLFIGNFSLVSQAVESSLLNGFLWTKDNNVSIGNNFPDTSPRVALQTGPLLFKDSQPLLLAINNDEPSRRIVAAKTTDNKLLFLAFYQDIAEYSGPMLGNLPEIISEFTKKTNLEITDAINLDGGKHSVFITNYERLNELEHIGSYFCVK